jgi:hypothetical protein
MRIQSALGVLISASVIYGVWAHWSHSQSVDPGLGVVAPHQPIQGDPPAPDPFFYKDHVIYPLASFDLTARILAKKDYTLGREAQFSPVDVALGWGPMSDAAVLQSITITQSNRWYFWRTPSPPIPKRQIETHSANMHLVPATPTLAAQIKALRPGQVIRLTGSLIRIEGRDGWGWQSSLTREDTGNGACELIWVETLRVIAP